MNRLLQKALAAIAALSVAGGISLAQETPEKLAQKTPDKFAQKNPEKQVYMAANAHFDTQWRWNVRQSIGEFLPNTLYQNFALMEQYPDYKFSFEGAVKHYWTKEYYPHLYSTLVKYVKEGRWYPAGASWDANDFNVPSAESNFKNILLAEEFYKAEFGVKSYDIMLPDCFGFGYALPSIASHCGVFAFHTQKLKWRNNPFYEGGKKWPFEFGIWEGVDGSRILMAPDGSSYGWNPSGDISDDPGLEAKVNASAVGAALRYYGTKSSRLHGDQGGSPLPSAVEAIASSIPNAGKYGIRFATTIDIFNDYKDELTGDKLPVYNGELLMDVHGTGCYTSNSDCKMLNRRSEQLGLAAEGAAAAADWLGIIDYPKYTINDAYRRFIWHQFHDDLPGTCITEAYTYTWNDQMLSQNMFAGVVESSMTAVTSSMDTRVKGDAVAIFNPVTAANGDIALVSYTLPAGYNDVRVYGPDGKQVRSQIVSREGSRITLALASDVPSMGVAIYDFRPVKSSVSMRTAIRTTSNTIENAVYKVTVGQDGDICSIIDKRCGKELVAEGRSFGYQIFEENTSDNWPAWEILKSVIDKEPVKVDSDVKVTVEENGPVRGVLRVDRKYGSSTFTQRIMLYDGAEDDRIDIRNNIDWKSPRTLLKAAFPVSFNAPEATYDLGLGQIRRGNNTITAYEVPAQQWADITAEDGSYGITIMNDGRYGWDKPDDNTLRLTLLHTPTADRGYGNEKTLDLSAHEFTYSIRGHRGALDAGKATLSADRLNQRKAAFSVPSHSGSLGKSFSMISTDSDNVRVRAFKKAEDGDGFIVRVYELSGAESSANVKFASSIVSAEETNGIEEHKGPASFAGSSLDVKLGRFAPATFRVRLAGPSANAVRNEYTPLELPFNKVAISTDAFSAFGHMDNDWHSYSAEQLPEDFVSGGVPFAFGRADYDNAVACDSQTIALPQGCTGVYLLAASAEGDRNAVFNAGSDVNVSVPYYSGFFGGGNWDDYKAFLKDGDVACVGGHRHDSRIRNEVYEHTYMFRIFVPVKAGVTELRLPADKAVTVFSATAVKAQHADAESVSDMVLHLERL